MSQSNSDVIDLSAQQADYQPRSLAMIHTRTTVGVDAVPVIVEVHLANGLPAFSTVGLPEAAVKESKDRVRGAILNSGFEFPAKRITVNLSPADLPKTGSRFDLPIAIGILAASGQISHFDVSKCEFIGELALNGELREVSGVLPTALACGKDRHALIVPKQNADEASLASQTETYQAAHLIEVCQLLSGDMTNAQIATFSQSSQSKDYPDFKDVKGQQHAKRALEIAAAGNHSVLMIGPPGTGKSMLAQRLPSIMPNLSEAEAIESAAIQSVADGRFDIQQWRQRVVRSPHHSCSSAALVGGGSFPKPGEISRAHHGLLFLDELTEFSRATLEQLREPIETGEINISRASHSVSYPARFLLVAACNPCPCGYYGDGTDRCRCGCTSIERYRGKLSGPLIDRIDIHIHLNRVPMATLQSNNDNAESSAQIQQRVLKAQQLQIARQGRLNFQLEAQLQDQHCALGKTEQQFLSQVCEKLLLSARAYHRILRLARTIADLDNSQSIKQQHLSEAVGLRFLDRN